jgi:hypothetical protein
MRRFPWFGTALLLPALMLLVLTGCPGPGKTDKGGDGAAKDNKGDNKGAKVKLTGAPKGVIKGTVKFDGTPPAAEDEPAIKAHEAAKFCLSGGGINVKKQLWIIDANKGVANVVISLEPPEGKEYDITPALQEPFQKNPVVVDQPFCQFIPHVYAVYADIQEVVLKNSASVTHNVKISPPKYGTELNPTLTPNSTYKEKLKFKHENSPIPIACSIHGWMSAKLWTFKHPYFAVTKEDGSFEIANVPIDEDLVVYMWHESMNSKTKIETRKFKEGPTSLDLKIK